MRLLPRKLVWLILVSVSTFFVLGACLAETQTPTMIFEESPIIQPTETEVSNTPAPTKTSVAPPTITMTVETAVTSTTVPTEAANERILADIVSVTANGTGTEYTFSVEISSPDTGCDQYADWWEVLTEDGELIYRRILAHSHVNEQPFTRSGGPVEIGPETVVIIRAHMHPTGYGGTAFRGSVFGHFEEIRLEPDFAPDLEQVEPLPDGCAF